MEKLTKKQLKGLSIELKAYYCGGNVYNHENIIHFLQENRLDDLKKYNIDNLIRDIKTRVKNIDKYRIVGNQIAYSTGLYGNTGQLVRYEIFDIKDNDKWVLVDTFYTYYC